MVTVQSGAAASSTVSIWYGPATRSGGVHVAARETSALPVEPLYIQSAGGRL